MTRVTGSATRARLLTGRAGGALTLLLSSVSLLACGNATASPNGGGERPAQVEVGETREGSLRVVRTYLGEVRSEARSTLAAGADGEVREVRVREGDRVERGDLLLLVDASLARAGLQAAAAGTSQLSVDRAQASRDAARLGRAGGQAVAEVEIERATARAEALEAEVRGRSAEVARARATLRRHRVEAPFGGVIARRLVDPGAWVGPGTAVLELVADEQVEVLTRTEPALLEDVEVGTEATFVLGREEVPATVVGVVRALDPSTRTVQVRLRPVEHRAWLMPGGTVDVRFELERGGEGLLVPRDALVPGVSAIRVVRVVDGRAVPTAVDVLERGLDEVRIRAEGLEVGDVIVRRGNERLRPDQSVEIVEAEEPPAEGAE